MWSGDNNFPARGFSTPPPTWKSRTSRSSVMPMSERKPVNRGDLFHVVHKVPAGDSPYVRAKQVQLIEKDPSRAISMFWAAINAGDRVDSALKDMAVVMKQLNRSDEAIEAIKSFRHLCPYDSQESLDNVLLELYKRSGRIEEEIEMLQRKLKHIEEGITFGGKRLKIARSQGKKIQITIAQEKSRIIGNLAWAYLQLNNYKTAEELYRKALALEPDKNRQCNLAVCLMHMNRITEAKSLLQAVRASSGNKPMDDSYARSFERAFEMLTELESQSVTSCKNVYASPTPVRRNLQVPYTQPRRCSWGFNSGEQRRGTWRDNAVGSSNHKLSFEQPITPKIVRAVTIQNLNGDLLASNDGCAGEWRRSQGDVARVKDEEAAGQSISHPMVNGDWKGVSWKKDGCAEVHAARSILQPIANGDGKKDSWENDGQEKFAMKESSLGPKLHMEPPIAVENARALETFTYGERYQSSEVTVSGSVRSTNTVKDKWSNSEELDNPHKPIAGNAQPTHDFLIYDRKKSWADQVEEEEQELQSGRIEAPKKSSNSFQTPCKFSDGWISEEEYNDENLDSNIIGQTHFTLNQIGNLSHKFKSFDLEDGYSTSGNATASRKPVQRSLSFTQQQKPESAAYFCLPPLSKKVLNFEGYNSVQTNECDSMPGKNIKPKRGNRLQVFQDITLLPENPGA